METKKPKWFKFFIDKWRSGTTYLSNAERGAYLELILYQFDKGKIPRKIVNQIAREEWESIAEKFEEVEPGYFENPMMAEMRDQSFKSYEQKMANLKDDHPRSGAGRGTRAPSISSSKSKSISKSSSKSKSKKTEPLVFPFTDERFIHGWQLWKDYKKEQHGFIYKHIGEQAALKHIGNLSDLDLDLALQIIQQSMNNGWKGLFQINARQANTEYQKKAGAWANDILKKHGVL